MEAVNCLQAHPQKSLSESLLLSSTGSLSEEAASEGAAPL
jgi:hypothetical protein